MRASTKLCAVLVLCGSASVPFLGCGSSDDDDAATGKADAAADSSVRTDGGATVDGSAPLGTPDGGGGGDAADAAIVCPTSAPADFSDAAVAAACTTFVYLAGGDDTRVIASTDGVTWASQEFDNIPNDDYVNNLAVYRGVSNAASLPGVFNSPDPTAGYADGGPDSGDAGVTFSRIAAINSGSTYGGEFAVGPNGVFLTTQDATYFTSDGVDWATLDAGGLAQHWYGSAAGPTTYVNLGDGAKFRAYDGTTFTNGVLPLSFPSNGNLIAYGDGMFVAVGGSKFTTSADGKMWTAAKAIDGSDGGALATNAATILWSGTQFLVYDYFGDTAAVSADTTSWTTMAASAHIRTAAVSEGHFVAEGILTSSNAEGILLSSDGINWTMGHVFTADEVATRNGWRVGVGRVLK